MLKTSVYDGLSKNAKNNGGGFLLLIDPDRGQLSDALPLVEEADAAGVDAILIGTSFLFGDKFSEAIRQIKLATTVPVILFPGSASQVVSGVDAILFMSLISGRNPAYLIDEQVRGAPLIKSSGIEAIPTGYMLIESGSYTSVEYVSNTRPIPRNKSDLAVAHALAAEYLGMKLVYLEAGSGARLAVPEQMITDVSSQISMPVIVGGGIVTPEDAAAKINAGASFVVVGTRFETPSSRQRLHEFAEACHPLLVGSTK